MSHYIKRKETIDRFTNEHQKLKMLVSTLPEEIVLRKKIVGTWTLKDTIAHLAAWNWEAMEEVERVLSGKPTWPRRYEDKAGEDTFNQEAVEKRKDMSWKEVLNEWDESFLKQVQRMKKLTEGE